MEDRWSFHKETIKTLFLTEDKSLNNVIKEMGKSFEFHASKAQYERQLRKWGFKKNRKAVEWKRIGQKVAKRKRAGKDSDIYDNGEMIPKDKARKEISRHYFPTLQEQYGQAPSPQTPENIKIYTPPQYNCELSLMRNLPWFQFIGHTGHKGDRLALDLPGVSSSRLPTNHRPNQASSLSVPDHVASALASWILRATCKMADHEIRQLSLSEMITTLSANGGARNMHSLFKATIPLNADMEIFLPTEQMPITNETGFESPYLSFVAYLLSNNLLWSNECDRVFQLLRDQKGLKFFQRLLSLKQPTIKAMAENLFNPAVRAGECIFVKLFLDEAGVNPNITTWDSYDSPIVYAALRNNIELVQLLLEHGADASAALRVAIRTADTEVVQLLLDHGAGFDDISAHGLCVDMVARGDINIVKHFIGLGICANMALRVAIKHNDIGIINLLLDLGATTNEAFRTVIQFADLAVIRLFLDRGADADIALEAAVRNGQTKVIALLLDYGADFDMAVKIAVGMPDIGIIWLLAVFKVDGTGQPHNVHQKVLLRVGLTGYDSNMIDLLRPHCYDIPAADTNGGSSTDCSQNGRAISAMELAVHGSSTGLVRELLKIGVDVKNTPVCKYSDRMYQTALHMAIRNGDFELIRSLLAAGADVHAQLSAFNAGTALQAAAAEGRYDMVNFLLALGSNVNDPPNKLNGRTALQAAAERGSVRTVRLLLDSGADPNAPPAETDGITAIQAAIMGTGDISLIKLLLEYGSDINMRSTCRYQPRTALSAAVRRARDRGLDLQIVQLLLDNGANVNELPVMKDETNALGIAVGVPKWYLSPTVEQTAAILPLVRLLLDEGADVNVSCLRPRTTSLQLAVRARAQTKLRRRLSLSAVYLSVIELLLSRGAGEIAQPSPGYGIAVALQAAVERYHENGDIELVRLLVKYGSNADLPLIHRFAGKILPAAVRCIRQPNGEELVRLLISSGANVNHPGDTSFGTALQELMHANGSNEFVKLLLDNGADINAPPQGSMGRTALQAAAEFGNITAVQLLLSGGADINAPPQGSMGRTALQAAAQFGNIKAVQLLLSCGADINAPAAYSKGVTSLQAAAIGGYLGIVSLLLEHHADVNAPAAVVHGRTALEGAAEHGRLDTVQLLLNAGVNLSGPDDAQYLRALELAKKYGHFAVAGVLRDWVLGSSEHGMADDKN